MHDIEGTGGEPAMGRRWPEVLMAIALMAVAAVVAADSLRIGAGWAADGPRAGYFPFYIGLLLFVAGASVLVGQLRRWRRAPEVFATRAQLASVMTLALPMLVYVLSIRWLGLYIGSALLIAWFMLRHGRHAYALVAAVATGVPLAAYVTFERWFLVPLPKSVLQGVVGF